MTTKEIQEWLTFNGYPTVIDGSMGPATIKQIKGFQAHMSLASTGVCDDKTQAFLTQPMTRAIQRIDPTFDDLTLGRLVVAYAKQHLAQGPIEIGGENRGPWVRLYMHGKDGREYPWCAGFATHLLEQSAQNLKTPMPVPYEWGCDELAAAGKKANIFLRPTSPAQFNTVSPGSLFLIRKGDANWQHTGIVEAVDLETGTFMSVEGNSNTNGSAEGYEVTRLCRQLALKDFILIP